MLFELFPSAVYETSFNVTDLPLELSAFILNKLEPEALFNAAKVNRKWLCVCLGDSVLRRRLRAEIQARKRRHSELLINPAMGVSVTRNEHPSLYGRNALKMVKAKNGFKYEPYQRSVVETILKPKKTVGPVGCKPMKGERKARRVLRRI